MNKYGFEDDPSQAFLILKDDLLNSSNKLDLWLPSPQRKAPVTLSVNCQPDTIELHLGMGLWAMPAGDYIHQASWGGKTCLPCLVLLLELGPELHEKRDISRAVTSDSFLSAS